MPSMTTARAEMWLGASARFGQAKSMSCQNPVTLRIYCADFFGTNCVYPPGARELIFRAVEDGDLIRQAARGSVEAYNLLVSRWEKRVYNYLLRITGNREDALDLTQDVFLKAYQNLRKLDHPGRFAPWLYRIAHNEAYSMFRKRRPETDVDEIEPEATETK